MQKRKHNIDNTQILNADNPCIIVFGSAVVGGFNQTSKSRKQAHAAESRLNSCVRGRAQVDELRVAIDVHPLAVSGDSNRKYIEAFAIDRMKNTGSGRARHQVFTGASAEDDEDARTFDFTHGLNPTAWPARSVILLMPASFDVEHTQGFNPVSTPPKVKVPLPDPLRPD